MRRRRRSRGRDRWLPWVNLALFGLAAGVVIVVAEALGADLARLTPDRVRSFVLSFGFWAPVLYVGIYGQPIIPLPTSIMMVTAGLAFGPLWGMVAALSGAVMRSCNQFLVARLVGRRPLRAILRGRTARLNRTIHRRSFLTVLLIRLIPNVPFDMQNYALGCSKVRFGPYALATLLGIVPATFAFVYLGDSLTDLGQFWKLLLALLALGALIWLPRMLRGPRRPKALATAESAVRVIPKSRESG